MPTPTIVATPGAANANSYLTLVEAQAYFDTRTAMAGWDDADDQSVLLIMATRTLDAQVRQIRTYVGPTGGSPAYWRISRGWTGTVATTTQKLAWPRIGMLDGNLNPILSTVIPQELKDAVAEFAGQLGGTDRTLDNDASLQGLKSLRAGSVALSFKDYIESKVLPEAVWALMPPWWFTDELITYIYGEAMFDVVSD